MSPAEERRAIDAVVRWAAHRPDIETAAVLPGSTRAGPDDDDEGLALARDHGIDLARVKAYASLAASRGVTLEATLRAYFRGELREIVTLPPVAR